MRTDPLTTADLRRFNLLQSRPDVRCELIREILIACYQPVESWDGGIGTHLAYLAFVISSGEDAAVIDLETLDETADTYPLYALLRSLFGEHHAVWLYVRPLYHTSTTAP